MSSRVWGEGGRWAVAVMWLVLLGCSSRPEVVEEDVAQKELAVSSVGNGKVEPGEECDDGNTKSGDGCSNAGVREANFYCWVPGKACSAQSACGNGRLDSGEACDVSSTSSPGGGCTSQCDYSSCGNGVVELKLWPAWQNEICDDGNRFDGDGCTRLCEVEPAYACKGEPSRCLLSGIIFFNTGVDETGHVLNGGTDPHWSYSLDEHRAYVLSESQLARDWPTISQTSWTIGNYTGHSPSDRPGCVYQDFTIPSTFRLDQFRMVLATFNDNDFQSVSVNGQQTAAPILLTPEGGQPWQKMVLREIRSSAKWLLGNNRVEVCNNPVFDGPTGARYILADAYDDLCGDGRVSEREECDDGDTESGDGCSSSCGIEEGYGCVGNPSQCAPTCSNGILNPGEQCDDGNKTNEDGCSTYCRVEPGYTCATPNQPCQPICGDGVLVAGEECDDGNTYPADGCEPNCRIKGGYSCSGSPSVCEHLCGNEVLDSGEQCDDGNRTSGDGCTVACTLELGYSCPEPGEPCKKTCGDGDLDAGERCDDGNLISGDGCNSECKPESGYVCNESGRNCVLSCGNGTVDAGEDCDDANVNDSDGCSSNCKEVPGYHCTGSGAGTTCVTQCGDGVVAGTEACDDTASPAANGNGCSATCTVEPGNVCPAPGTTCFATCGNGAVNIGEQCDDGGIAAGDGCSPVCSYEPGFSCSGALGPCSPICGDGIVAGNEVCDDGNLTNTDSCTNDCKLGNGRPCTGPNQCAGVCNAAVNTCAAKNVCGNGAKESGEACDDGNKNNGDGCSSSCRVENDFDCTDALQCISGICDMSAGSPGDCEPVGACGNGVVEEGESCDDGNTVSGDDCSANCAGEGGASCGEDSDCESLTCDLAENGSSTCEDGGVCGNGQVDSGEVCDDGNTVDDGNDCGANCLWTDGAGCSTSSECVSGICNAADGNCAAGNVCGNGKREGLERCDDGNLLTGDGCDAACKLEEGQSCVLSLQCGVGLVCNRRGSHTCVPADECGNGVVEGSEVCDDGNSVDSDRCTNACLLGAGANCSLDSDCVEVCDTESDLDCELANVCGNGHVEGSEVCDDGNTASGDGCDAGCKLEDGAPCTGNVECSSGICNLLGGGSCAPTNTCGNGLVEGSEVCDDGNTTVGDGCDAACLGEDGSACTDDEECSSSLCNTLGPDICMPLDVCGNGELETGEACDDGNRTPGDGCGPNCKGEPGGGVICVDPAECSTGICNASACVPKNVCGNGVVETGEACDDGNAVDSDTCSNACLFGGGQGCTDSAQCVGVCDVTGGSPGACEPAETCGNGQLETGESCDDGNVVAGDGCSSACLVENDGPCQGPSDCTSALCNPSGNTCVPPDACGNGFLEGTEVCDDGNLENFDGCDSTCHTEIGLPCLDTPDCEIDSVCNTVGSGNCEPTQQCGNGLIETGVLFEDETIDEVCDDGNNVSGDGCSSRCLLEDGKGCGVDSECETGRCGIDHHCGGAPDQSCSVDTECRGGMVCDPDEARCGLVDGKECGDHVECRSHRCSEDGICLGGMDKPCTNDSQCAATRCAGDGACGGQKGDFCLTRLGCRSLSCDSKTQECRGTPGQACTGDDECANGICKNGACGLEPGEACTEDKFCQSGTCRADTKICGIERGEACESDDQCAGGVCASGTCGTPPGGQCGRDNECMSGYCDPEDELCDPENGRSCTDNDRCRSELCNALGGGICAAKGICGNGLLEGGEGCDDGNVVDGDACASDCLLPNGGGCMSNVVCASGYCDQATGTCMPPVPDGHGQGGEGGMGGQGGAENAGAPASGGANGIGGGMTEGTLTGGGCSVGAPGNANLAWLVGLGALGFVVARRRRVA